MKILSIVFLAVAVLVNMIVGESNAPAIIQAASMIWFNTLIGIAYLFLRDIVKGK